jgi:hypothetical protein
MPSVDDDGKEGVKMFFVFFPLSDFVLPPE